MVIDRFLLTRLLRWRVLSDFPEVSKSITVFAPHTSYWDAIIGKLVLRSYGVRHTLLSKKELFHFPMSIAMHLLGAMPIGGVKGHNALHDAVSILESEQQMHLVICPEGQFYMAVKAGVPIIVVYLDYAKRTAGVKGVIRDLENQQEVYRQLAEMYADVTARHPVGFLLPRYKVQV